MTLQFQGWTNNKMHDICHMIYIIEVFTFVDIVNTPTRYFMHACSLSVFCALYSWINLISYQKHVKTPKHVSKLIFVRGYHFQ